MHYVGIDVAKATLEVSDGEGRFRRTFQNTTRGVSRMLEWLMMSFDEGVQVVLEPTSTYHHLVVDGLAGRSVPFTVINPARTKAYATLQGMRAKTDRVDAQLLASLGESQRPDPSDCPDRRQEEIKSLRRHREWLEGEIRAARNRLGAASHSPWTAAGVIESLKRTISGLEEEAEAVEGKLEEEIEGDELYSSSMALLETIPGVGRRTAVMILSELPPAWRCRSSRAWVAFSGLAPEPHQSGNASWSKLSRSGSARIRSQLYMAAVSAMRWNSSIRDYVARLKARGKTGKLAVVAAMNRLIRICYGVLRNRRPFDPHLHHQYITA